MPHLICRPFPCPPACLHCTRSCPSLQDRGACALLMFPTKALAQDQLRALREACAAAFGSGGEQAVPHVEVYDGDTPMAER